MCCTVLLIVVLKILSILLAMRNVKCVNKMEKLKLPLKRAYLASAFIHWHANGLIKHQCHKETFGW